MKTNKNFIISYNSTCFNHRFSGANQRFFTIYLSLIKRLKNINFNIYEPIDADLKFFFKKTKNTNFIKTSIKSESSKFEKFLNFFKLIKIFINDKSQAVEIFNLPFFNPNKKKISITIHDLRYFNFDKNKIISFFYKIALKITLYRIPNIITVSHSMKKELQKFFPNKNISVIHNAIEKKEFEHVIGSQKSNYIRKKYNIYNKFIFSIGHLEERKNYRNLIEGYNLFLKKNIECQLIISGFGKTNERKEIIKLINTLNLNSHVLLLENVNEIEKIFFYQNAEFFIFPSLYEGFGIPLLEAMASNCPIVASNIAVFKEIIGKDGIFFNPKNTKSIYLIMQKIYSNNKIKNFLINIGKKRIDNFSTKKVSKDLENYYYKFLINKNF